MKFAYVKFQIFYKPVLPVVFKFGNKSFPYQALIDTGADMAIIHAEIAEQLGLNLEEGDKYPFAGICGTGKGYIHKVDLEIGGCIFKNVPIIFTRDINPYGFGILGHEGFFDQVKLVFELSKKQFEIIPKTYKN
jgi:predicted aspartyl protease